MGVDALNTMKEWFSAIQAAIQAAINHTVCRLHLHICMHASMHLHTVNIIKLFNKYSDTMSVHVLHILQVIIVHDVDACFYCVI